MQCRILLSQRHRFTNIRLLVFFSTRSKLESCRGIRKRVKRSRKGTWRWLAGKRLAYVVHGMREGPLPARQRLCGLVLGSSSFLLHL